MTDIKRSPSVSHRAPKRLTPREERRHTRWNEATARRLYTAVMAEEPQPRVILAEDDGDMRALLGRWLRAVGFVVLEAADGEALAALVDDYLAGRGDAALVDLLISDIRMPGASGLGVLGRLRERDPGLPVILVTAFGSRGVREEAERLGASLLSKPFRLSDLRERIASTGRAPGAGRLRA